MSTAPRYIPRYTADDHLLWEGDWQLIGGIPVAMTPSPVGKHDRVVVEFVKALYRQSGVGFYLIVDPEEHRIEIMRNHDPGDASPEIIGAGSIAEIEVGPDCRLEIDPRRLYR